VLNSNAAEKWWIGGRRADGSERYYPIAPLRYAGPEYICPPCIGIKFAVVFMPGIWRFILMVDGVGRRIGIRCRFGGLRCVGLIGGLAFERDMDWDTS
jgi:hypothetical protein